MKSFLFFLLSLYTCKQVFSQNVGIGTTAPQARLHVTDSSVLFSAAGDISASAENPPLSGAGRRMMWYAEKAAFRVGHTDGIHWDEKNIGSYSFASGNKTIASGYNATAIGNQTTASEGYATAMGDRTIASGVNSTAMGLQTTASG